jgi:hypothetical protein
LTILPDIDWNAKIAALDLDKECKQRMRQKLDLYRTTMKKNKEEHSIINLTSPLL